VKTVSTLAVDTCNNLHDKINVLAVNSEKIFQRVNVSITYQYLHQSQINLPETSIMDTKIHTHTQKRCNTKTWKTTTI